MSSRRYTSLFRLTPQFDASDLVASFKKAGWVVRRGRLETFNGVILDTSRRLLTGAGLAVFKERSNRRSSLDIWLIPTKCDRPRRLLLSKAGGSLDVARLIYDLTGLRTDGSMVALGQYRKDVVPFNAVSKAGRLTLKLVTVRPEGRAAKPLSNLLVEVTKGNASTLALAAGLVRLERGVDCEPASPAGDVLSLCSVECGPRLAAAPVCERGSDVAACAVAILKADFANMLAHEAGARVGLDPEYVHNMRVANRRMRAALRMFSRAFAKPERARINVELRWLARVLGEVRDLDVYIDAIPRYLSRIDADAGDYSFFLDELRDRHGAARSRLVAALDSPRYAEFTRRVERFLSRPPLSGVELRLEEVAAAGLRRFSSEVFDAGGAVETEGGMHALRIAVKRLRYAVEFLCGLAPKRMGKLSKLTSRYQDVLGRFNDATVACLRVRKAARETARDGMEVFLLGYLLACQRLAALDAKSEFIRRWRAKGAKRLSQSLKSALAKL